VAAPNVWNGIVDFVTPVRCQLSMPNWKHTLQLHTHEEHPRLCILTFSWHYQRDTNHFTLHCMQIKNTRYGERFSFWPLALVTASCQVGCYTVIVKVGKKI